MGILREEWLELNNFGVTKSTWNMKRMNMK